MTTKRCIQTTSPVRFSVYPKICLPSPIIRIIIRYIMCQSVPGTLPSGTVTVSVTVQYLTSSLLNPRQLTWPKLPTVPYPCLISRSCPGWSHASTLLVNMATDSLHPNPFVQGHSGVHAGSPSSLPSPVEGIQVITIIQYLTYSTTILPTYCTVSASSPERAAIHPALSKHFASFNQPPISGRRSFLWYRRTRRSERLMRHVSVAGRCVGPFSLSLQLLPLGIS